MAAAANSVTKRTKWTRGPQLGVGDLVLAKVEGFPPWPAKVSRPQDYGLTPSRRKLLVEFFGTREIAFVALQDLLPFTEEVKSGFVNHAREKQFPKSHAKGLEQALLEIHKVYDELPKPSETANGLLPDRTPDLIEKPTEPLVKLPDDGVIPKPEQIDDYHERYLSLKRKEREIPKPPETANGLLPDRAPDPIEKHTEPLVKSCADGATPKLEQICDFHERYPSLERKEREIPKPSETANGLFFDRTPDPTEKRTEPLVKPCDVGVIPKLEQMDDFHERYPSLKRKERDIPKSSETANDLLPDGTSDLTEKPAEPTVKPCDNCVTPILEQIVNFHESSRKRKEINLIAAIEAKLEDPYSIQKCIAAVEGLPNLQMEDTLKGADLFTDNKGNREVFLSFSSNALRLGWLRRKIQNT